MRVAFKLLYIVRQILYFLILLGCLGYLTISYSWSLKKFVLPLIRSIAHIDIDADEIHLWQEHTIAVKNFSLNIPGELSIGVHSGTIDILASRIVKKEYIVTSAELDGADVKVTSTPKNKDEKKKPAAPPLIEVKDTRIRNSNFHLVDGALDVSAKNINLDVFVCGQDAECQTKGGGDVSYKNSPLKNNENQEVRAKLHLAGNASLTNQTDLENYSLKSTFDSLTVSGLPVTFNDGSAAIDIKGKKFTGENNTLKVAWNKLVIPNTVASSQGEVTGVVQFVPRAKVVLSNLALQLFDQKKSYAGLSGEGTYEFPTQRLRSTLKLTGADERVASLFSLALGPVEKVNLDAEVQSDVTFSKKVSGKGKARFVINDISIPSHNIAGGTLNGSMLSASGVLSEKDVALTDINAVINRNQKQMFDLKGAATVTYPDKVKAAIETDTFNLAKVLQLAGVANPESKAKELGNKEEREKPKPPSEDSEIKIPLLPNLEVTYNVKRFESETITLTPLLIQVKNERQGDIEHLKAYITGTSGEAKVDNTLAIYAGEHVAPSFGFDLSTAKFPLKNIAQLVNAKDPNIDPGEIERVTAHFWGGGRKQSDLKKDLAGEVELKMVNNNLSSKFQDIPPFNLIFLPINVVANMTGSVAGFLLPDELTSIASGLRSQVSEGGRLSLENVEVKVTVKDQEVQIAHGWVDPNLLPGIDYQGSIGFDGDLDIRAFIVLLGVKIALPIAGTLDRPLPNVVRFVPELIKGLGLSAFGAVKGTTSFIGRIFGGSKDEKSTDASPLHETQKNLDGTSSIPDAGPIP